MSEWIWLSREAVDIFHEQQLGEHGGLPGIKDENALDAALARPTNKAVYENRDVFELAAAYLFGIAKNHPFSDGNKRTAFVTSYVFLRLHGFIVEATQGEIVEFVLGVASGEIDEPTFAAWLRERIVHR